MAYLGVQPTAGQYRKLDDISGSFNGSTTTFTTQVGGQNVTAGSAQSILVSLGGVIQSPGTNYSVSTNSITFVTAPTAGLSFFAILLGEAVNTGTPSDGTVTPAKLSTGGPSWNSTGNVVLQTAGTTAAPALQTTGDTNTGIYFPAADTIGFVEGGAESARFDSNGRFLVGTSSSASAGNAQYAKVQIAGNTFSATEWAALALLRTEAATAITSGEQIGGILFGDSAGNEFAKIECHADANAGSSDYPGRLTFSTTADGASSPTERMRIRSDGLVGIRTTTKLDTNVVSLAVAGVFPNTPVEIQQDSTNTHYAITFRNGNGLVGNISTSGSATSFNTSSDYRLKENVVPLTGAIDRVNQLQPSQFNFIADPSTTVDGFIAHEAQTVVPECVTGTKDEVDADGNPVHQGIDQSKLVPLLTAALQEAIGKIEDLETRLSALEAS